MHFNLQHYRPGLLVLDMQRLFTAADGPFGNPAGAPLCTAVNALAADCAGLGLPVLMSSYLLAADGSDAGLLAGHPVVAAGCFNAGNPWSAPDPALQLPAGTLQLQRNRPGAFHGGALEAALDRAGISALLLCGLSVNNAISTTAREAFARDIPTVVVRDATGMAPGEDEAEVYFQVLDTWTASVLRHAELLEQLRGPRPS